MTFLLFLIPVLLLVIVIVISKGNRMTKHNEDSISNKKEPRKTIYDLFDFDLNSLLIEKKENAIEEITEGGNKIRVYEMDLSDIKPFGIFDSATIRQVSTKSFNITFMLNNCDTVSKIYTKKMINAFVGILGKDDSKKGWFTELDWIHFKDPSEWCLWGRKWMEYPKYKNPVAIQKDEFQLELTIWGLEKTK